MKMFHKKRQYPKIIAFAIILSVFYFFPMAPFALAAKDKCFANSAFESSVQSITLPNGDNHVLFKATVDFSKAPNCNDPNKFNGEQLYFQILDKDKSIVPNSSISGEVNGHLASFQQSYQLTDLRDQYAQKYGMHPIFSIKVFQPNNFQNAFQRDVSVDLTGGGGGGGQTPGGGETPSNPYYSTSTITITPPTKWTSVSELAYAIANQVYKFSIPLSVIALIIVGLQFMTAGGNEDKLKKAKRNFTYVIIGILVISLSVAIAKTIENFFLNS